MPKYVIIEDKKIDLDDISKSEFVLLYNYRYKKYENAKLYSMEMIDYLEKNKNKRYNFSQTYREMCRIEFIPKMDKLIGLFENNVIRIERKKYPVVFERYHEVNGEYVCSKCGGHGGKLSPDPKDESRLNEIIIFETCPKCNGEGRTYSLAAGMDMWKPYITDEEKSD